MIEQYAWHKPIWEHFVEQYQHNRVPHALLLTGPSGLAKKTFANQMVQRLLCEESGDAACGQCQNCQLLAAGNHPDHTDVMPAESGQAIKIEQIRQLKEKQALTAHVAKAKTVIIAPADSMNRNAYNSLLKLLEEPQENSFIILITQDRVQLPITITSRCQQMAFQAPSHADGLAWLQAHHSATEQELYEEALTLAKGSPLLALQYLQEQTLTKLVKARQDFGMLVKGQANPVEIAQQWQDYDLTLLFHYLQRVIQQRIQTASPKVRHNAHYWHIYDCIIKSIKLLSSSSNVNKVLLIEQFMMSVVQSTPSKSSAESRRR